MWWSHLMLIKLTGLYRSALSFLVIFLNLKSKSIQSNNRQFLFHFRSGFNEEALFTVTERGYFKLIHEGYEYTKDRIKNDVTFWRCFRRRPLNCLAKARTRQINERNMVAITAPHNHAPLTHFDLTNDLLWEHLVCSAYAIYSFWTKSWQ